MKAQQTQRLTDFKCAVKHQIQQLEDAIDYPGITELKQRMTVVWKALQLPSFDTVQKVLAPERTEKLWRFKMDQILNTHPKVDNEQVSAFFDKLKPLTVQFLSRYARKVDPNFKIVDSTQATLTK